MKLTAKREKFAAELAKGKSQADAYRVAFPRSKAWKDAALWSEASSMAKIPEVAKRVAELTAPTLRRLEVSVERILQERARLAFFDPRKLLNDNGSPKGLHELDDDTAAAIAGLDTATELGPKDAEGKSDLTYVRKYKLADKNASLTALEKHLGMYADDGAGKKAGVLNIQINLVG